MTVVLNTIRLDIFPLCAAAFTYTVCLCMCISHENKNYIRDGAEQSKPFSPECSSVEQFFLYGSVAFLLHDHPNSEFYCMYLSLCVKSVKYRAV